MECDFISVTDTLYLQSRDEGSWNMGMVCEIFLQNTVSRGESVFSESLQKKKVQFT